MASLRSRILHLNAVSNATCSNIEGQPTVVQTLMATLARAALTEVNVTKGRPQKVKSKQLLIIVT